MAITLDGTSGIVASGNITANTFIGDGSQLTNLPAGNYSNANVANYLPTYTGNLTSLNGDVTTTGNVSGNFILGDGSQLTNLPAGNYSNANVANYLPTFTGNLGTPNTTPVNAIYANNYFYGNGAPFSGGGGGGAVFVTSNISAVVAGQPITVVADFSNITYPGGVFTITQPTTPPPVGTITLTDVWTINGNTSKNAYIDFANSIVNTSNVNVVLTASNTTFNVQSSDDITIGGSVVTGANLLGLGISGAGGTFEIPSDFLANGVQTTASITASANLTTANGVRSASGTTLLNIQPTLFNIGSIVGTFPNSASVPFFLGNQTLSWSASGQVGTITSGTVELTGPANITLATAGETSGTQANVDSVAGNYVISGSYTGTGLNGAGSRTVNVSANIAQVSSYTVLFTANNFSNVNPNFDTSFSYYPGPFQFGTIGQGANNVGGYANTPNTRINWYAIPVANTVPIKLRFDLGPPFDGVFMTPPYAGGPFENQNISGVTYQVYGIDGFNANTWIYITSS